MHLPVYLANRYKYFLFPSIVIIVQQGLAEHTPLDNSVFFGVTADIHQRMGQIDFGQNRFETIVREPLYSGGITCGKNVRIPAGLRLHLPFIAGYGIVQEGILEDMEIIIDQTYLVRSNVDLYSHVLYAGFTPMIQLPMRLNEKAWTFCAVGVGGQYMSIKEVCKRKDVAYGDGQTTDVRMTSKDFGWLENGMHITWSISASGGFEWRFRKQRFLSLQYGFTYWTPVNRMTHRDLFPLYSKPYKERFLSHSISLIYYPGWCPLRATLGSP